MKELIFSSEHFGFVLSIFIFLLSIQIKVKFKSELLNPLLLSTIFIVAILVLFRIPYKEYQKGADLLSYFLTPATVCLAIPLYKQISLLKNNFIAVFFSILLGTLTSLGSILLLGLLFRLKAEHIFTLLPKSITTAIGIGVSEASGGYVNLTVAAIVITGILGFFTFFRFVILLQKVLHWEQERMLSARQRPWNTERWKAPCLLLLLS